MAYEPSSTPPVGPSASCLAALADPTRRAILERLRAGPLPVGDLARGLPVSRPAVSQHLRVLAEAGLLVAVPQGTRRLYGLDPAGVEPLRRWLESLWDDALTQFAARAEGAPSDPPAPPRPRP